MTFINIQKIGHIESAFNTSADPFEMRKHESVIVIDPAFEEGLYRIEENEYIQVIFYFDQSEGYSLKHTNYFGQFKGVFSARSPHRPSSIGVTNVRILRVDKNRLYVKGLDALNNTPVLDIKPYTSFFDSSDSADSDNLADLISSSGKFRIPMDPRRIIKEHLKKGELKELLLMTGQIHGHYCKGVTLGVIASYLAYKEFSQEDINKPGMEQIGADADGFEDIIAIVEVNSCMVDGIQFTGGFTLGNNGLVYSDIGKSAVTFVKRNQEYGLRFYVNRDYMNLMGSSKESGSKESGLKDNTLMQKVINENNRQPELVRQFKESAFRGAFEMLDWDFTRLFKKERVKVSIPGYAKIVDSFKCSKCGEQAMITRCRKQENKDLCPACFGRYMQVSGSGIAECLD